MEDLCQSSNCTTHDENAAEDSDPLVTERTDKTFDAGVGLETFSGSF